MKTMIITKIHRRMLLLAAIGLGLLAGSLHARNEGQQLITQSTHYERFIAVDDACGWPNLCLLPSGTIAMFIWPYPNHGQTIGTTQLWTSTDAGRHWKMVSEPVPNQPTEGLCNIAAGVTKEGNLITVIGGMDNRRPPDWISKPDVRWSSQPGKFVPPIPAISRDGGITWQRGPGILLPPGEREGVFLLPYGQIWNLADGQLGVMLYNWQKGHGSGRASLFVSADQGMTWTKRGELAKDSTYNETTWIPLANGDLYAAGRSWGHLDGYRSTDQGRTWKFDCNLAPPGQHPGNLISLPDGRILVSYGVRNVERWGIAARVADKAAHSWSWSGPIDIVDLDGSTDGPNFAKPTRDGGYPSTIVLPDKTMLTAYYSRGNRMHFRYHVGVVKWEMPVRIYQGNPDPADPNSRPIMSGE